MDCGWELFNDWLHDQKLFIDGSSVVKCAVNRGRYYSCKFSNVTVDFSKARQEDRIRVFAKGFFTTHGVMHNIKFMFDIFGKFHYEEDRTRSHDYLGKYEVTERRPTFIISHNDIFNLGHHMNNIMNVWQMSVLAGNNTKDSLLINFDGFRENGPAGGDAHRPLQLFMRPLQLL